MAKTVTKDMIIVDLLKVDEAVVPILMASGMHCIGCPSAQGESLEEACFVHEGRRVFKIQSWNSEARTPGRRPQSPLREQGRYIVQ